MMDNAQTTNVYMSVGGRRLPLQTIEISNILGVPTDIVNRVRGDLGFSFKKDFSLGEFSNELSERKIPHSRPVNV